MTLSIGVIGAGSIVPFHLDVLSNMNVEISCIAARNNSASAQDIALKYGIPTVFEDWQSLIRKSSGLNAVIICTPPEVTLQVIKEAALKDLYIFAEKPGATSSEELDTLESFDQGKIFFGFNRRFYDSVDKFKNLIFEDKGLFYIKIIEDISYLRTSESIREILILNSIHIIDLLHYLAGDFRLESVVKLPGDFGFRVSVIDTKNVEIGQIFLQFGTPSNSFLSYENDRISLLLKPIEKLFRSNRMMILEPSISNPIRQYIPSWFPTNELSEIVENSNYKPGFESQMKSFVEIVSNTASEQDMRLASVRDAIFALKVAEALANSVAAIL